MFLGGVPPLNVTLSVCLTVLRKHYVLDSRFFLIYWRLQYPVYPIVGGFGSERGGGPILLNTFDVIMDQIRTDQLRIEPTIAQLDIG